ncbi:uncharacterized protein OCT59_019206 [Rhizophagus irregularis]|uniref:Uncharacterized protein n=1 Tax=Rhizophagus irregularis (strain DAOM 181602 / DAOM 197198 / MUCL 43194) TaxID=747089 RepID=U9SVT8_RHIID|nr:hypothetical protein OCT59_019206 [Rhizophagus irregularis]GBC33868.1 hypothetical protein GLOIN_2v1817918 [Rhizophagus irregularis DAOM 181602=DAOM 197198]
MTDIEETIDLYAEIPTFYPDYKPIIDKMPPSLIKRAFDQLLIIKRNPVLPKEITEKSDRIEQYLRNKLIVYEQAKNRRAFVYSMDTGMQTEDNSFSDKATQTDSLDKATQTDDIDFLGQIKRVNMILINAVSILSNI